MIYELKLIERRTRELVLVWTRGLVARRKVLLGLGQRRSRSRSTFSNGALQVGKLYPCIVLQAFLVWCTHTRA